MAQDGPIGNRSPIAIFFGVMDGESPSPFQVFDVHGSLTYGAGHDDYPASGGDWWLGFDCHHDGDGEIEDNLDHRWSLERPRSLDYVEGECERLAEQFAALTTKEDSTNG